MNQELSVEERFYYLENRIITLENDIKKRKKSEITIEINPNFFITLLFMYIIFYYLGK
jgi:hypothetical protein